MAVTETHLTRPEAAPVPARVSADKVEVVRIEPVGKWLPPSLKELWDYRELLYFLIWRDIKVRYKQTLIGAAWAVLQPLMTMLIFTIVFRTIANVASDGLPYSVFSFSGLLPWTLFAGALSRSVTSLVGQSNLISKVYFPRLIVPVSATIAGLLDFAIAFVFLGAMMAWYGIGPRWTLMMLPLFVLLTLLVALAVGLWLSALNVRYRDVAHVMPVIVQLWMFASPVAYPMSQVPSQWRLLYSLNPLAGIVTGFRWALFGTGTLDLPALGISTAVVIALLIGGTLYFTRMERTFADVV